MRQRVGSKAARRLADRWVCSCVIVEPSFRFLVIAATLMVCAMIKVVASGLAKARLAHHHLSYYADS